MPQYPTALIFLSPGGNQSALNVIAAGVLSAGPITCYRITVSNPGSSGNLTLNDCATTGAANAANEIYNAPFGDLSSGQVITLKWTCASGLVLSSIPTGGAIAISAGFGVLNATA